jgi:hypothetical protein
MEDKLCFDIKKIVKKHNWNIDQIKNYIVEILNKKPNLILKDSNVSRYLQWDEIKKRLEEIILKDNNRVFWLSFIQKYIEKDRLISLLHAEYEKSPWLFFRYIEKIRPLFDDKYFENKAHILKTEFLEVPIWKIFLLLNGHRPIFSFWENIQFAIKNVIDNSPLVDININWFTEPGLACGGMEANYIEAARNNKWLCMVNNIFLAKFYHRKWEAKKVAYLPCSNYITKDWIILRKDCFYTPSKQQHHIVIDSIQAWQNNIIISDLCVKLVRPCLWITSNIVLSLLSDQASFMTGSLVTANEGYTSN